MAMTIEGIKCHGDWVAIGSKMLNLYDYGIEYSRLMSAFTFHDLLITPHILLFRADSNWACGACLHVFSKYSVTNSGSEHRQLNMVIFDREVPSSLGSFEYFIYPPLAEACAIYNNWWPMLSALMYVLVPMPCLFFGGGSTQFLISRDGGGWIDAAKFLTGASAVGSIAIPIILRHADLIGTGAMFIEFTSFFIFVCTVMCFHRASLDDEW
ncbi:hypothetical protein M9H77_14750 [Catharanthus roseus]|uniref:Uncharacterized protein n=1 Tax=Catharanthus roseus TaxID=4058 RepID=A0ACC0BNY2_CATRO|nr:hypothetical protein M9H77_14750 [Catharanthus roseus]